MLGGWLGSTGCLRCLPGFTPFPLHHSITHLTRQSFLLDCPPDSLFSIFSASAGLRTSASFSVIPSSLFGLILLPSFPICPLRCSHPPLLTPVGVCQASLSTLAVLGSLGFSQAHRSPSPLLPGCWEGSDFCSLWVSSGIPPHICRQGRWWGLVRWWVKLEDKLSSKTHPPLKSIHAGPLEAQD